MSENIKSVRQKINSEPQLFSGDFDFQIGEWEVKHRRLKDLFSNCNQWVEFKGTSSVQKILGGLGNLEDNTLHSPGASFNAIALRSFNIETSEWSIWWLDGRYPGELGVPVVGKFIDGIGLFIADDFLEGMHIKIQFKWDSQNPEQPRWEQSFSKNNGISWETNWTMDFIAVK
jgi:hypothetical protein